MVYKNCIVINSPESWMTHKIYKYLIGGPDNVNIKRWRKYFNDKDMNISCEKQDSQTTFIIINTENLLVTTDFLNNVINKIYEGIARFQSNTFNKDTVIRVIYRYDYIRNETEFINGKSSCQKFNEKRLLLPYSLDEFISLST